MMLVLGVMLGSCTDDPGDGNDDDQAVACVGGQFCVDPLVCVDGYCVEPSGETGDGDGDPPGDGDGDPPGDGDGDPPGDGDGDPPGDGDGDPPGDGDGDPPGDGDGDPPPGCGNGTIEGAEECEDGLPLPSCIDLGYPSLGPVTCEDCMINDVGCMRTCGNGQIDLGEQCDGANLNGFSCMDLGYAGGLLKCNPLTCTYETDECFS